MPPRRGRGRGGAASHNAPNGAPDSTNTSERNDAASPSQSGAQAASPATAGNGQSPSQPATATSNTSRPSSSASNRTPVGRLDSLRGPGSALGAMRASPASMLLGRRGGAGIPVVPRSVPRRPDVSARQQPNQGRTDQSRPTPGAPPRGPAASYGTQASGSSHSGHNQFGRGSHRGRGQGRGGYMGERHETRQLTASGPLSSGVFTTDQQKGIQHGARSGGSSSRGGSKVKKERGLKTEDANSDIDMDITNISSSDDEVKGPRKDVDLINLVSSSDEDEDDIGTPGTRSGQRTFHSALPIRIRRQPHVDRAKSINTEASSATSAAIRQAKDSGVSTKAATESALRKGKTVPRDLQAVSQKRRFRGAWSDSEDEPGSNELEGGRARDRTVMPKKSPTSSPERSKKGKAQQRRRSSPILQTEEDRREYQIRKENLILMREELGNIPLSTTDQDGDQLMSNTDGLRDNRQDRLYLFQLPPVLPSLVDGEKSEHLEGETKPINPANTPPSGEEASKDEEASKGEEGDAPLDRPTNKAEPLSDRFPQLDRGLAGKLRVHESGRTTLTWGGIEMDVTPAIPASFLQDVVYVDQADSKKQRKAEADKTKQNGTNESEQSDAKGRGKGRANQDGRSMDIDSTDDAPEGRDEAISLGRIRGKFIVTPNWDRLLGDDE